MDKGKYSPYVFKSKEINKVIRKKKTNARRHIDPDSSSKTVWQLEPIFERRYDISIKYFLPEGTFQSVKRDSKGYESFLITYNEIYPVSKIQWLFFKFTWVTRVTYCNWSSFVVVRCPSSFKNLTFKTSWKLLHKLLPSLVWSISRIREI